MIRKERYDFIYDTLAEYLFPDDIAINDSNNENIRAAYADIVNGVDRLIFQVSRETIGAYDNLISPEEHPDENGQVMATYATHRNQLRDEQQARLDRILGDGN
jgi:hypothetical protein